MSWELFDEDPLMMTKTYFVDNEDGSYTLVTEEDQSLVLENNLELRKQQDRHQRWGDGQLVASIPMTLYWDLYARGIVQDEAAMKRWLNSSENVMFRKRHGWV
jgi:hypothetical protein